MQEFWICVGKNKTKKFHVWIISADNKQNLEDSYIFYPIWILIKNKLKQIF